MQLTEAATLMTYLRLDGKLVQTSSSCRNLSFQSSLDDGQKSTFELMFHSTAFYGYSGGHKVRMMTS